MKHLFLILTVLLSYTCKAQQVMHVSPSAPKGGRGTLESPYSTIGEAQRAVRKINKKMKGDITVYLHGGNYHLSSPLVFKEEDSGMNDFRVVYKAYNNETPVISGGRKVSGWQATIHRHIFCAPFGSDKKLRTLFVNGHRARMAGTEWPIAGQGSWGTLKVEGDEPWAYGEGTVIEGIKFLHKDLPLLSNAEDVELVQRNIWNEKILCTSTIDRIDRDTLVARLQQPYGTIITALAWAGATNYKKDFVVRNAFELLDSPGEFYFDRKQQLLYYYSDDEDMTNAADVVAPVSEGLVRIYGSSNNARVQNLAFEGITFAHDAWELMEVDGSYGFGGIQSLALATKYIPDGNWHPTKYNSTDVPQGTIDVKNSQNISFTRNRFVQLGSAVGISYVNDVIGSTITGNYFNDLLGNAVCIGHPQHYEIGDGDLYGAGVEGVCKDIQVTNNYIRNVSLDFRMLESIVAFFVENVKIDHNDIAGTPYGAIACGWWWGNAEIPPSTMAKNNSMSYNKAGRTHLVLNDGGILYALGQQPNTVIKGNYLYDGPRCIYPDDGSAHLTITGNLINNVHHNAWLYIWVSRCHDMIIDCNFVRSNISTNNGRNTIATHTIGFKDLPEDDGRVKTIMDEAGIQPSYKDIIPAKEPVPFSIYPLVPKDAWH